ncbi:MAG TPA: GNAT family N-acetyltransferase [Fibrobacteria bacterium]|nr:GNAT family N-acetyltransferase [Fibrobacteria bacterium]
MIRTWSRDLFTISTDPARLYIGRVHRYLAEKSYWARNIPLRLVRKALAHSRCYGIHEGEALVGFGRLITDYVTFAFVSDVFVKEERRGLGLSKWLVRCKKRPGGLPRSA